MKYTAILSIGYSQAVQEMDVDTEKELGLTDEIWCVLDEDVKSELLIFLTRDRLIGDYVDIHFEEKT